MKHYLVAIFSLITLTLLFFWKILLTNLILVGTDTFLYFYPYKAAATTAMRAGHIPLWNPDLFMGAPLMANSQVGVFYPLNWLLLWLNPPQQLAWSIGLHILIAALGMVIFTRNSLQFSYHASLTAAILFAFGGYLGAQVEHINQLQGMAWLPYLFLCYDWGMTNTRNPRTDLQGFKNLAGLTPFLLLTIVIAFILLAGHAQTAFISLFGLGLYAMWQGLESTNLYKVSNLIKVFLSLTYALSPIALASLLAIALAAVQLLPTAELSRLSIRQSGLIFQEVVSFSENPTLLHYSLLPTYGLDLTPIYGEAFSEWVAYLGVSGLILAMLGALTALWQSPPRRFIFIAICGLILSLGVFLGPLYLIEVYFNTDSRPLQILSRITHPYYFLYKVIPGFALFRVPARWLLLYSFGMAILAGYGMASLSQPMEWRAKLFPYRSHLLGIMGIILLSGLALLLWKPPPMFILAMWLVFGGLTLLTISRTGLSLFYPKLNSYFILILITLELFLAARGLNYNQPTAPQAYTSMRNAVAYLRSVSPQTGPPDRFLSLSGTVYDPGDLADMQQIYAPYLTESAFYKLVVATKQKEVLAFNLPMLYGLHSVDGYDGGILPLAQFVTLQKLFLPADNLSTDGRLREKLRYVPDNRLLSMLNTRWIITDKVFDAWIDGIFYDLQFPAKLTANQVISTTDLPTFPATAIGLVSHLEGAATLPNDTPVAQITVTFANGQHDSFTILTSRDTAEGRYTNEVSHAQAKVGVGWPYDKNGTSYITVYTLTQRQPISNIEVKALLGQGQFILRGLSLIHQPTTTSRSIILSTEGNYRRVHSGDVKIYENLNVLPRAYLVPHMEVVTSTDAVISRLLESTFDPRHAFVTLTESKSSDLRVKSKDLDSVATITDYHPEQVIIKTTSPQDGWLILTDTNYPDWQATIDGQPIEILPANLLFRAVAVPQGEHEVRFEYKPRSYQIGLWVSGLAWLGVFMALGFIGRRH